MDYVIMHWDEYEALKAMVANDYDLGDRLPNDVGSAMEILRYEKIGRWEADNWDLVEDLGYDASARRIAEGGKDRRKQDALYVRIGRDGRVCGTPRTIGEDETCDELGRAQRYKRFVNSLLDGETGSYRYDKALAALKVLFAHQA